MLARTATDAEQEPGVPLLFLSHAGEESDAARALAVALRGAGVEVWLDVERLKPGDRWQHEIGAALRRSHALILYVGRAGVARWVDFEVQIALDRAAKDGGFRLIPVLGPGADPAALPDYVKLFHWLDLRGDARPAPEKLKELLTRVLNRPAERIAVLPPDRPPFRGLLHFDVEDAVVFFGRERETEELLKLMSKDPFLLVVGDSGCGKSSLVRAGLVPALLRGRFHDGRTWVSHWQVAIARPGNDPFGELAESLPDLASEVSDRPERINANRRLLAEGTDGLRDIIAGSVAPRSRTLLVVDQFEELFTLTPDAVTRRRYIDCLLRAANVEGSRPAHVVVTLRADFFGRCWENSDLLARARRNQYLTPRLSTERLRELIERPLAMAGAEAEPGLIETMLGDVGDEPGNLALLEHALDQLWKKRQGGGDGLRITHEAYESLGRLSGALRTHANAAMERLKGDKEKALARRFFVDLTQLGEGTEDMRRRVKIEELTATAGDREKAIEVLEKLASERLITTGDNHAEVAHEELIRSWPELRSWIDADRDFVRRERRFLEDAKEWQRLGKDPEALLRGARLVEAEAWRSTAPRDISPLVLQLLKASVAERKREEEKRERLRHAELARLRRSREVAVIAAAIFVVLAAGLAYFWWSAREASRRILGESRKAQEANQRTQQAQRVILARGLAAQAQLLEVSDPIMTEARVRLALESMRRQRLPENERLVRDALELLAQPLTLVDLGSPVYGVGVSRDNKMIVSSDYIRVKIRTFATGKELTNFESLDLIVSFDFSPDGRQVVGGGKKDIQIWEVETGKEVARLKHEEIFSVSFSPDGKKLLSAGVDKSVRIWEISTGKEVIRFKHDDPVISAAFSPDGKKVASGSADRTVRVWETSTGKEVARFVHKDPIVSVAFSPDGKKVASGSLDKSVRVWDLSSMEEISRFEHESTVLSVAFSPNGRWVASGSLDRTARVWDISTAREIMRAEHEDSIILVDFSPYGQLVSGSVDGTVRAWELASNARHELSMPRGLFGDPGILSATFSADGRRMAGGLSDNSVRIWDVASGPEIARSWHEDIVTSVAFSPDEKLIVSGSWDDNARVWDAETGKELARLEHGDNINAVGFSPDGRIIVTGGEERLVRIWDWATETEVLRVGHDQAVTSVAFSSDGKWVVSGSWDETTRVWDTERGAEVAKFEHEQPTMSVAFSPNNRRIASGCLDGTLLILDTTARKATLRIRSGQRIRSAAFSGDGKLLLIRSQRREERYNASVWDLMTRKEIAHIERRDSIQAAAFLSDGRRIVTVSGRSVGVQPVREKDLLDQTCRRLSRNFTPDEWKRYLPSEPYQKTCPNLSTGR